MRAAVAAFQKKSPEWKFVDPASFDDEVSEQIVRLFAFQDFLSGLDFVSDVASVAEAVNHHPEITLRYGSVTVSLTTHEADDTVTDRDLALAQTIDTLYMP